eukprot:gnl/MRDRNA2_/MRDRNA2_29290_c0_seq1.p1 gnl/MRDRNA2_/MRDRNA2_29290_c0~~gnl/MRDRNA2_/MRDRNA2_29290_c0_seq1.p1  ORF type:complete len:445 (+),score=74.48 gnl/MRDRNA2_/MRDRNA2_29290_c0_seq1:170-1504(+)
MISGAEAEEVPKCHLHRKANKACRFCKAYVACQEQKQKEIEDKKKAVIEQLKVGSGDKAAINSETDPIPIPHMDTFPNAMKERIMKTPLYYVSIANQPFENVVQFLADKCDSCEIDVRNNMDVEPSCFICSIFRLLTIKLTEGKLREMMESPSCWVRCASFFYIRRFCHSDRYWDLLSDSLVDEEEFVPFPKDGKNMEAMTVGEYVEYLLSKEKYCDVTLPRITAALRKSITERLCLYGQFRKRYMQNLEVLHRFERLEGGLQVEVCRPEDGEWFATTIAGAVSIGSRLVTVPIFNPSSQQVENVSISRLICKDKEPTNSSDLTRSRGTSNQVLLEKCREQQRANAMATGKNYNQTVFPRHQIRIAGVAINVGGAGSVEPKRVSEYESDEEDQAMKKRKKEIHEAEAKRAAIEAKYLASSASSRSQSRGSASDDVQGPDRMRLG